MFTILVIEDQKLLRTMLCDALREYGFELLEAADGMEGMTQMESGNISLVITDLVMPNFDGVNFLNILTSCHPETKVISWTSLPKEHDIYQKAAEILGEDRIVQKSSNYDELFDKVRDILKPLRRGSSQ